MIEQTIEQLRDKSAQTQEQYEFIVDLARKANVRLTRDLAQAHAELKDLQGANRAHGRQLADVTDNREYWYKEARSAEVERDEWRRKAQEWGRDTWSKKVIKSLRQQLRNVKNERDEAEAELALTRQAMQEQSDEVQELWLCPAEAEGLKRQLAKMQILLADARRVARLWYQHIKELQIEHDQLVDRVEDAMGQIEKYDKHIAENHIQYAVEDILEQLAGAEAQAALVTPRMAELLERLARHAHFHDNDAGAARTLAASIREALEANDGLCTIAGK